MIILIFSGLLLIILGWLVDRKKWYWLISGYNTMSAEKKKNVDIEGLARYLARHMYVMGGFMILATLFAWAGYGMLATILFFALLPQTMILVVQAQSFDGNAKNEDGSYKMSVKLIISFMALVLLTVTGILYFSLTPARFLVEQEALVIQGMYGRTIPISQMEDVKISDTHPVLTRRVNGSAVGEARKGRFQLENRGSALVFLENDKPPYLLIQTSRELIIINSKTEGKVSDLFTEISEIRGE